jgi:hypothetical protein
MSNGNGTVRLSARIPKSTEFMDLLGEVRDEIGKVQVPGMPISDIERLSGDFRIQLPDPSTWSQIIVPDVVSLISGFPDAASLAGPLNEPLQKLREVASFDFSGEAARLQNELMKIQRPALDNPERFFSDLLSPLSDVNRVVQESEFLKLLQSMANFLGLEGLTSLPADLTTLVSFIQAQAQSKVSSLVLAFAAVSEAAALSNQVERSVQNATGNFSLPHTRNLFQGVLDVYGEGETSLAAQVARLDFQAPDQVQAIKARLEGLRNTSKSFHTQLVQDLGFTEASLTLLDMPSLQQRFQSIQKTLSGIDISVLDAMASDLHNVLTRFQQSLKFDSDVSIDKFRSLVETGLQDLRRELDKVDLTQLENGFQSFFQAVTEPLKKFEEFKAEVEALIRDAYQAIHDALKQIDLSIVRNGFDQAIRQVENTLGDVDQQVTAVRTAIESSLGQIKNALVEVRTFVLDPENGLKRQIESVFNSLFELLDGLHLQDVIEQINQVLDPISAELQKIEFAPVINGIVQAIDAVATVLQTVAPLLVTDSLRDKLTEAVAFLREIDLYKVREALLEVFEDIRKAVDEEALGKFEAEYQKVIQAVDQLDPSPALESLQHEVFDPLIAELEKVQPAELLQGLQDAYDAAASALSEFDPSASLRFLTGFFDDLLEKFHQISTDELLTPVENALSEVRKTVNDFLHVDEALNVLNDIKELIFPMIDNLNVSDLFDGRIDSAFQAMKVALDQFDLEALVGIVMAAIRDLFANTGIDLNPAGAAAFLAGLRASNAGLQNRFARGHQALQQSQEQLKQFDLREMLLTLRARHAAVKAPLETGLVDFPAHLELLLELEALDPMLLLSPLISKASRLQASYGRLSAEFGQIVTSLTPTFEAVDTALGALAKFHSPAALLKELFLEPVRRLFPGQDFPSVRELIFHYLDEINPKQWRGSLEPLLLDVQTKLKDLFGDALFGPLTETLNAVKKTIDGLNITALREAITAIQAEVEAVIQQVNPAPLIQELKDLYDRILELLEKLNPAEFIAKIEELYSQDVIGVVRAISPRELLLPVLQELFQNIKNLLVAFDIQVIFEPILTRLNLLWDQLAEGLQQAADAYDQMLDAIPTSGSVSAEVSVNA